MDRMKQLNKSTKKTSKNLSFSIWKNKYKFLKKRAKDRLQTMPQAKKSLSLKPKKQIICNYK